jgi:2-oxoacid:acceptor oxidoreductase delta subunit (pyruvate/2-ketoisovalerate family)
MKQRTLSKIVFRSYQDMPEGCVSVGDMSWNRTGSWRYVRPIYTDRTPPCSCGCPCGVPIERWMGLVADGEYDEALEVIRMEHPFPSILGRVCFHPCEGTCNRAKMEGAVSINALERHIGDMTVDAPPAKPHDVPAPPKPLKVAVVGSGPAGLGAAYHLRRLGHEPTVLERMPALGGMLRYGIPSYRLPKDVLDRELNRIAQMGIPFKTGDPAELPTLFEEGYDRVFLAFGAQRSRRLGIPGDDHPKVRAGLGFLHDVVDGKVSKVPDKVLVVGGGNTAVDCARTAVRLGGKDVRILYRRTENEMPAFPEEVKAARDEGVAIDFLVAPAKASDDGGNVALTCIRMELGEPDASGRRRPVPIEGSEFTVVAGLVLSAIGEEAELDDLAGLEAERGSLAADDEMRTSDPKVFAGGDMTDNPRTVIDALASGKRGAIAMDCEARGLDFREVLRRIGLPDCRSLSMGNYVRVVRDGLEAVEPVPEVAAFEMLNTVYIDESARHSRPEVDPAERTKRGTGFVEVHPDLAEDDAIAEAMRCMHCGTCIACDNCYIFCPDAAISPQPDGSYVIDYDYCKGCGLCVHECPRAAMALVPEMAEV